MNKLKARKGSPTVERIRELLRKIPDGKHFKVFENAYDLIFSYCPNSKATEFRRCYMKHDFTWCDQVQIESVCESIKDSYDGV